MPVGTGIGLLLGRRLPPRVHEALTTGLGFFMLLLGISMGTQIVTDPAALGGGAPPAGP